MERKLVPLYLLVMSIILMVIFFSRNNYKIELTEEEEIFIQQNRETIFMAGYYSTSSDQLFGEKLCKKIEEDTSLKIRLYEDTWENNLYLLEKGKLPILLNMNKTEEREKFTLYTPELNALSAGIYSLEENKIYSYASLEGKVIGTPEGSCLLDNFKTIYPNIDFKVIEYNTVEDIKEALEAKEIDGFVSTKSFDNALINMNYFEISVMSEGNNYIGVSNEYPVLHKILSKEIKSLKRRKWDTMVYDVINFELEKMHIDLTLAQKHYLENQDTIVIGIPKEYFLYAHGEEYNPKGIIPKILEKIEFLLDIDIVIRFDYLENLRLRNDIDLYIDNEISKKYGSIDIFESDVLIAGLKDKKVIKEIYNLAPFNVGVFGVPNVKSNLLQEMPQINIREFENFEVALEHINKKEIDYLIIPESYLPNYYGSNGLIHCGDLQIEHPKFVSDNKMLIEALSKPLSVINIDKIVEKEIYNLNIGDRYLTYLICIILLGCLLFTIIRLIYKGREKYYKGNPYDLYNRRYIDKQNHDDVFYVLYEVNNAYEIINHYGKKIYFKTIKRIISSIEELLEQDEYVIYIEDKKFLIVVKNDPKNLCAELFCQKVVVINKASITLDTSLCYTYLSLKDNIEKIFDDLNTGLSISKDESRLVFYDEQERNFLKSRIAREINIRDAIQKKAINIQYTTIYSSKKNIFANYVQTKVDGIKYNRLTDTTLQHNLQISLDKGILSFIILENKGHFIVEISEKTLLSKDFFQWLTSKMNDDVVIYFLIEFEKYEECYEHLEKNKNIQYIIKDFGKNLFKDCYIKYYDAKYLLIESEITYDLEENTDVIAFIKEFAEKYNKKIISRNKYFSEADYYIEEGER